MSGFPYDGPDELLEPVTEALARVIDPEVGLNVLEVGLVYGVTARDHVLHVDLTMTSAACPVADVMCDNVFDELERVLPQGWQVEIELVWEPPWTPERLSDSAKQFMGW